MRTIQFCGAQWDSAFMTAAAILKTSTHRPRKMQIRALAAILIYQDPYVLPINPYYLDMEVQSLIHKGLVCSLEADAEVYGLTWRAKKLMRAEAR